MKKLAVVPARGGSKRFPGKNLAPLHGRPLILHTLDQLYGTVDTVLVISDSKKIHEAVKDHPCNPVLVEEDSELADDTVTVLEVLTEILFNRDNTYCDDYAVIGLFLPTAPLRSTEDVKRSLSLLSDDIDGVISTTDYSFPPELGLVRDPDGLIHCADTSLPFLTGKTRSQDYRTIIRPNGAIYWRWMDAFGRDRNFFKGQVMGYHMPRSRSVDIDDESDLAMAHTLEVGS